MQTTSQVHKGTCVCGTSFCPPCAQRLQVLREDKLSLAIYGPELQPQHEKLHSSTFFLPSVLQKSNLSAFLITVYEGTMFESPQMHMRPKQPRSFGSDGFYTNTTTQPARWQSNLSEAGIHPGIQGVALWRQHLHPGSLRRGP